MARVSDIFQVPVEHEHLFVDFQAILKLILSRFLHFWASLIFGIHSLSFQIRAILWLSRVWLFDIYWAIGPTGRERIQRLGKGQRYFWNSWVVKDSVDTNKWLVNWLIYNVKLMSKWANSNNIKMRSILSNNHNHWHWLIQKTIKYSFIWKHTYLELICAYLSRRDIAPGREVVEELFIMIWLIHSW